MDELVYNLTNLIDDDTILFVMGDHGMTKSGDHGKYFRSAKTAFFNEPNIYRFG